MQDIPMIETIQMLCKTQCSNIASYLRYWSCDWHLVKIDLIEDIIKYNWPGSRTWGGTAVKEAGYEPVLYHCSSSFSCQICKHITIITLVTWYGWGSGLWGDLNGWMDWEPGQGNMTGLKLLNGLRARPRQHEGTKMAEWTESKAKATWGD